MERLSGHDRLSSAAATASWDRGDADLDVLVAELVRIGAFASVTPDVIMPLRTRGLNHAHLRIQGTGALLRIPRLSAFGLDPLHNLAYQKACFLRAAPSEAVPELLGVIEPQTGLPWGAFIVREVSGCVPELPRDLPAIARSLAAIHQLILPDEPHCHPLRFHKDPVRETCEVVLAQSAFLEAAGVSREAMTILEEELQWVRDLAATAGLPEHPVTLVGTDTHPGNFLITGSGKAIFVDLEKMIYGSPAIDLAHASVYTSTTWDEDIATALTSRETAAFMESYFAAVSFRAAERIRSWCQPMRRLTWLRTTTWCARWNVEARQGGSWSPLHRNPEYMETIRKRFEDYLKPSTLVRVRDSILAEDGL